MTLEQALAQLEALGDDKIRAQNTKRGYGDKQYGVPLGAIRKLATKIKSNHALAMQLWDTGIFDAKLLAILLLKPATVSREDIDRLVRTGTNGQVADWLNSYVVKEHPDKVTLRERWMHDDDPWAARAGWSLTSGRAARSPEGIDLPSLLDRIEAEMGQADPAVLWAMNSCLASIGINHAEHRARAIAIGEALGVYRDYPVSKGCTSPFAPIWIGAMVRRQS
ncbi:DNA alkylation repair protein [Gemmatimonas groenlandica]|uniref:DNA alkylation repair protein n=1 Tax=Gemmatimonas groenlandica TaxID=2732249 RepID=A0A6M4IVB4_9BACT|nr:DNA alkylation repair protein [Gemmatimonas groenlandica]QJR37689.1 DNA alkylation repair protein [Gemmatimonas groenlandica]